MRSIITILVFFSLNTTAFAGELPFNIIRDANGKLVEITISHKKKAFMSSDEFLNEFKMSVSHASKGLPIDLIAMEGFKKLSKKEQKAYLDSLDSLQQKTISNLLDDQTVKLELDKVVELLTKRSFFKLLASPYNPKAFDEELILVEAVKLAMDIAKEVLGTTPLFSVLEFLVSEYFEALVSQREFYQNALLNYINTTDLFTAEESAFIKSSIFYSRISLTKPNARKNAVKKWNSFGHQAEAKATEKCAVSEQTSFHYCFKIENTNIMNLVDKNNILSKKASKTFDYKKPGYVGQTRWFILAAKLGLKLLPAPGVVKSPVKKWLESFYKQQRRTEGYLYSAATLNGEPDLTSWLLENTANPLIY